MLTNREIYWYKD